MIVDQSSSTEFEGQLSVAGGFTKSGSGTLTLDGTPSLASNSVLYVDGGTLSFYAFSGAATIGTGVQVTIAVSATLHLGGSVSELSEGSNYPDIYNYGTLVVDSSSTTTQVIGRLLGMGNTVVDADAKLSISQLARIR